MGETCANCGTGIGKLETPHVWNNEVVCGTCIKKLRSGEASPIHYQSPAPPPPHRMRLKHKLMLGFFLFCTFSCLVSLVFSPSTSSPTATAKPRAASQSVLNPTPVATHEESWTEKERRLYPMDDKQPGRKAFIQKMIDQGFFQKVEFGSVPKVWVTPKFMLGDFDSKKSLVSVVVAYAVREDPSIIAVSVRSSASDKEVGTYNLLGGGFSLN